MDTSKGLVLWIGGAAGIMLIYAGIKGDSPLSEVKKWFGSTATDSATDSSNSDSATSTTNDDTTSNATSVVNSSYTVGTDNGTAYTYDQDGNPVSVVPSVYQGQSASYIPSSTGS